MIYWAPFLHLYQPPTQFHEVLKRICDESYRPLFKVLAAHPHAKLTINICGVLTEMLDDHGASDVITGIRRLAERGQIEFVDSSKYHAILPLIPPKEAQRQIELNNSANLRLFGESYRPAGFFPPEMCYSDAVAELLCDMDYKWMLISGIACPGEWPMDFVSEVSFGPSKISVFYRDDIISNKISFRNLDAGGFIAELINLSGDKEDTYVITAMDAETFGHHIRDWEKLFLSEVFAMTESGAAKDKVKIVSVSEVMEKFPAKESRPPHPSSWSTTKEDMHHKNYYILWKDHHNPVHELQWEHLKICFELTGRAFDMADKDAGRRFYEVARAVLDKALHSCQFWWASRGRGMWDINMINRGLMLQEEVILNAYKAIKSSDASEQTKKRLYRKVPVARDIADKIRDKLLFM